MKITCFSTATDGSICNMEDIRFPRSRKTWFADEAPAAYWTVYDGGSEDSNLLMFGNLSEPSGIRANVIATVPAGELMINMNDLT